ncbi:hypothetical protein HY024_02615, partial [Candidatus Curtissbacteria bacterium]|nr:hypothetical protein [Candidatus Curtissbacteria bacterium]
KVPIEFGPLFIGYSPYGPKEGLNGQIDLLGILNQGLSEDQVKLVFAAINSGADVSKFIVATNGVVAVWPFERSAPFHDVTGNGHEGTPKGSVTLAPVTTP